ncbi:hypothetical protein Tco_1074563, partial [Tanacetum coccineum]
MGINDSKDDTVSSDEEWEEHEYGNPPNDSFPKPYLNTNNERDKSHHKENNGDTNKSGDMVLSGTPHYEELTNGQLNKKVKMDNPNINIEEYIRLEQEKAHRRGKVYNWETATYGKIWDNEDVHDLRSVETEFPAIVFNDTLTSEALLCEPTVSSHNNYEIDFRILFDKSDDEDCT